MRTFFQRTSPRSLRNALFTLLLLAPSAALAQGAGNQAEAQALFDAGRKLMEQGNYAEACPKLEASQKLDPGAGTLLNLANCYEKNGQFASAWVTFTDAANASQASGHPDWAEKARNKANAIAPKISKMTITVTKKPDGLEVKRDGKPIAPGALDVELPVDPGIHLIEASAPHKVTYRKQIEVRGEATKSVVTIPELDDAPAGSEGGVDQGSSGHGNGMRILGVALASAGAIGIAFGIGFGIDATSKKGILDDPSFCLRTMGGPARCNQKGADQLSSASTSATISTIAIAAGAALIVGGGILFFTAPKSSEAPKTGWRFVPSAPSSVAGLAVEGSF